MTAQRGTFFVLGFAVGGLAVAKWRSLLKGSIKLSISGTEQARRVAAVGVENLADITEEARYEMMSRQTGETPKKPRSRRRNDDE